MSRPLGIGTYVRLCCAVLLFVSVPASAQEIKTPSKDELIARLLKRLDTLEAKIKKIEDDRAASLFAKGDEDGGGQAQVFILPPAAGTIPQGQAETKRSPQELEVQRTRALLVRQAAERADQPADIPPPEAQKVEIEALGTSVFRENTPTVGANKVEIGASVTYGRTTGFLQSSRSLQGVVTARYGIAEDWELTASVPYYFTERSTETPGGGTTKYFNSVGDASLRLTTNILKPSQALPGMSISGTVTFPTGASPYIQPQDPAGLMPGADVRDFFTLHQSRAHWAFGASAQFYKIYDPVILFLGTGIDIALSRNVFGLDIEPGPRYTVNAGLSVALSEYTTIGMQFQMAYDQALKINGSESLAGDQELAIGSLVVVQRLDKGLYLEPVISIGLTDDASDLAISLGIRKQL